MPYYTPLRYPGGKRRLASTIMRLIEANNMKNIAYVEAYAGGAAVALALLMEEYASEVHINDFSRAVHAFWYCVLHHNSELCRKVEAVNVTMDEWHRQRAVYDNRETADITELGFATLFMNRANRSGILAGGVIGGKGQTGDWGLDARFGKPEIISRIKKIGRYSNRIHLYNLDALEFTKQVVPTIDATRRFAFYDPPYIENGADLYLNDYTIDGHRDLSDEVSKMTGAWVVTYDHSAIRHDLYPLQRRMVYGLNYTAQSRYEGKEVMFFSDDLKLPASWKKSARILLNAEKSDHPVYGVIEKRASKRSTIGIMKPPPTSPEFSKFTSAMRQILSVSKTEIESRISAQKQSGKRLSKPASRVSASASNSVRQKACGAASFPVSSA